jgi:hypothetical protein
MRDKDEPTPVAPETETADVAVETKKTMTDEEILADPIARIIFREAFLLGITTQIARQLTVQELAHFEPLIVQWFGEWRDEIKKVLPECREFVEAVDTIMRQRRSSLN